jgi:hypothetical protein
LKNTAKAGIASGSVWCNLLLKQQYQLINETGHLTRNDKVKWPVSFISTPQKNYLQNASIIFCLPAPAAV